MAERPVEPLHRRLGVTDDELDAIRERLGRSRPRTTSSSRCSASCGASTARTRARSRSSGRCRPPATGVVAGPGENAGVISIGDGLAVAFKIESHNHPSAVEPYQGAATGVGRDPARHLHDGRATDRRPRRAPLRRPGGRADAPPRRRGRPRRRRLRQLRRRPDRRRRARLRPELPGQSARQRHGHRPARGAAADAGGGARSGQPRRAVRLGDRARRDRRRVRAGQRHVQRRRPVQAAVGPGRRPVRREAPHRGQPRAHRARPGRGAPGPRRRRDHLRDLGDGRPGRDRDPRRPRRDPAPRARPRAVRGHDLRVAGADVRRRPPGALAGRPRGLRALGPAGRDHRPGDRRRRHRGRRGRPRPRRPARRRRPRTGAHPGPRPDQRRHRPRPDRRAAHRTDAARPAPGAPDPVSDRLPERGTDPGAVLLALLGSADLASRHAVFHQYDSTVGADTVAGPGRGAAVLRVKGTTKALVATTDGNQSVGAIDPWLGAALSVAEATRNVVDHRRPAARRHELPQLRRPDPARGVLAADRRRPRPGRRLPRAGAAGDRRQRLALQRVAGRGHRADAGDRGRRPARRHRRRSSARPSRGR